jgi:hypothetical protein
MTGSSRPAINIEAKPNNANARTTTPRISDIDGFSLFNEAYTTTAENAERVPGELKVCYKKFSLHKFPTEQHQQGEQGEK